MRYAAAVSEHLLVLDVDADRYLMAPDAAAAERISAVMCAPRAPPAEALWPAGRPHPGCALDAIFCLARVSRLLERAPFATLVQAVRETPLAKPRSRLAPATVLASYEAVRPFFWKPKICRLDAPALCLLMRHRGHAAELVFGARLEPFGAHCWAEFDGAALNESHVRTRSFTPVLAI